MYWSFFNFLQLMVLLRFLDMSIFVYQIINIFKIQSKCDPKFYVIRASRRMRASKDY